MSILFYKRPDYVDRPVGPLNQEDCQKFVERTKNNKNAIPEELSFDNVINNRTKPPCSLDDFMDYLVYVAHDAETLQFYLWLQDYTKRYNALRKEEQALSPMWTASRQAEDRRLTHKKSTTGSLGDFPVMDKESSIRMKELAQAAKEVFGEPPMSPTASATDYESFISKSVRSQKTVQELAEDASQQAGLKWQPFTCQPFRAEIARVIAHYFAPGAPRELNLSHRDRTALLHALQHTTHPSAFQICDSIVETTLRAQLHPNFIRWSICNGNKPKIFFVRTMGVSHILFGLLIALLLTLSSAPRWYRILNAPVSFIGWSTMVAAYKGLCIILHATGKVRNVRPWEELDSLSDAATSLNHTVPFDEEATIALSDAQSFSKGSLAHSYNTDKKSENHVRPRSFDTFGSANTFGDESWVERYSKKSLPKKVFETSVWVQDDAVRLIQDKIIQQAQIWAIIATTIITVAFTALPKGNFY